MPCPHTTTVTPSAPRREEWEEEERKLFAALRDEQGQVVLERPAEGTPAHEACWKLRSIYGQALWCVVRSVCTFFTSGALRVHFQLLARPSGALRCARCLCVPAVPVTGELLRHLVYAVSRLPCVRVRVVLK